jgi:phosphate transport system permease protein
VGNDNPNPKGGFYFGKEGGILNAIIGSIYLAFGATFIAFIIGLPISLYMTFGSAIKKNGLICYGLYSIFYGEFHQLCMAHLALQ